MDQMQNGLMFNAPIPSLFPDLGYQSQNKIVRGNGQLSWLSSKAGVIQCSTMNATVSFQLKDFCDQGVTDFTSVLRPGFRLAFQAVANDTNNEFIANYVAPLQETDTADEKEINLEEFDRKLPSDIRQASSKDQYSLELEIQALSFLLSIFQKNGTHNISLSSLHSRISNSGRDDLYRYIGSSSLKRRQFIERRSYVFHVTENDVVFLQPAEIYNTVLMLASFLLRRGGVTSSDALFNFFNNGTHIPQIVKDTVQTSRVKFMELLATHPFAFAPFPSQFYVSVRRNLPFFDYARFIKKASLSLSLNFPNCAYPIRVNGSLQYPPNGTYPSFDQAASGGQMDLQQFNANGQLSYPNMFQDDTPVVTPRNPWTAADPAPTPTMQQPSQQQNRNVPPALSPFQNITDPMYLNGGNSNSSNMPSVTLAQPMSAPKLNHPGVIGDRTMTRHNSVSSGVGSNLYDIMLRSSGGTNPILGDPRGSCSPPLSSLHSATTTSNGGTNPSGRSTCEMSTQTDENSCFDVTSFVRISTIPSWKKSVFSNNDANNFIFSPYRTLILNTLSSQGSFLITATLLATTFSAPVHFIGPL
ncbi:hypothetical protein M3Y97_00759000 [Aphelenchoides bicaudatus]|nr:hypothetical protein M3Y97_00759000 [Aphelenchoides bicaudatus]